jgi:hypothetical protein
MQLTLSLKGVLWLGGIELTAPVLLAHYCWVGILQSGTAIARVAPCS